MDLRYDVPEDADGPQYRVLIEFDESRFRFLVGDESQSAEETDEWTDIGEWREAALWMARQLLAISRPAMLGRLGEVVGGANDGEHVIEPTGSPRRVARELSDDEVLLLLSNPLPGPLPE